MSPILGYWKIKGLVQPTRLLLEYLEEKYEEHLYERDEGDKWRNKKFELGLEFPNLPYYIDGDVKLTQSMAIIRYIADKHNMLGGCPKERAEISMLEGAVLDIRYGVSRIAYSKDFETLKVDFLSKLPEMLKMFEDRLCHKTYLNGDHVTHPDFMLYDALDVVLYMDPMCLDAFPKLVCFKKRIEAIPQIDKYLKSSKYIAWPLQGWQATFGGGDHPPKSDLEVLFQGPLGSMCTMSGETKTYRLKLVTWNVGDEEPLADFTDLLDLQTDPLPDIYGIGLQEVVSGEYGAYKSSWTALFNDILAPKGFCLLKAVKMQGLLLVVYIKKEDLLCATHVESEISRAGMGGWWGNKGGVSIRFDLNGVNVIIVNAHLAAHRHNSAERIEDFLTVLDTQKFRDKDVDHILDHDYVLWIGDLNFRIDDLTQEEVQNLIEKKDFETLRKKDQLIKCREEGLIFCDFEEGQLDFPPTYKFDKGTDTYDSSIKRRVPAWCDRILWQVHDDAFEKITIAAELLEYRSLPFYVLSDHKPVVATFKLKVFPCQKFPAPVIFDVEKCWKAGQNVVVRYKMRKNSELMSSSRDWIGLYKDDFKHLNDYVTYVWARELAEGCPEGVEVTFSGRYLSGCRGSYRVAYISNYKDTLLGLSEEFQIVSLERPHRD